MPPQPSLLHLCPQSPTRRRCPLPCVCADSGAAPSCCRDPPPAAHHYKRTGPFQQGTSGKHMSWPAPLLTACTSNPKSCVEAGKDVEIARANPSHGSLLGVCACKCLSRLQEHRSACLATTNHTCSLKTTKSFSKAKTPNIPNESRDFSLKR